MKKHLVIPVLVLLLTLSITVPAFADPNPPDPKGQAYGVDGGMGEWASRRKIIMPFWMMYLPGSGQGNVHGYKWGPMWGLMQGNCEIVYDPPGVFKTVTCGNSP
jgi:hypothetical protein